MEGDWVGSRKGANQRAQFVRVAPIECRMGHERLHALHTIYIGPGGLHCQPLIHHQRFVLPPRIEVRQHCFSLLNHLIVGDPAQRREAVRQIVRSVLKTVRGIGGRYRIRYPQIILSKVPQRTQTNIIGVR